MRLEQLERACAEYSQVGKSFDDATRDFRQDGGPVVGLPLMTWLNRWGCRQFARAQHETALGELRSWNEVHQRLLPRLDASLMGLSDEALAALAGAYDDLSSRLASHKRRADSVVAVHFGPTGAAKVLYALRPNCCPPWDIPIRKRFGWDGGGTSYLRFLHNVRAEIADLIMDAECAGFGSAEIPQKVGRPNSSLPKLVDEYYWITITRREGSDSSRT